MKLSSKFPSRVTFSSKIKGYFTVTLNEKRIEFLWILFDD